MSANPNRRFRNKMQRRFRRRSGVALVIILSAIVIVSILITLFLANANLSRQVSFASAAQSRAEAVADLGLETIIGDLRSEIAAGSTNSGLLPLIYLPSTNFTVVPFRTAADGMTNIVKRSAGRSNFWEGTYYSSGVPALARATAGNSTTNASQNGRYLKPKRWNAPYLMGSNLPIGFQSPDWILITRQGAVTNGAALPPITTLANSSPSNDQYVLGRFAYIIYDEGGLLDVTLAGYPSGVSSDFSSRRGLLPQVDLGLIPGISDANALVAWRNQATKLGYANHVLSETNGFLEIAPGDQTFLSRQDLLQYQKQHPQQLSLEALQYLGTYTRQVNAPSYTPASDRPKTGSQDDIFNPSLIDVRVSKDFTRSSDGQSAVVGEPLLKYRFPLSRLALFSSTSPQAPGQIATYFGLTRSSPNSPWIYRNGTNSILKLSEVAAAGREPDFFELLQAGIAFGSLASQFTSGGSDTANYDKNTYLQIAQIVANQIDQYDANSKPTRIRFGDYPYDVCGVENLPYLTRFYESIHRYTNTNSVGMWYEAEVWNPHAQINLPAERPTQFRFRAAGVAAGYITAGPGYLVGPRDLSESPGVSFSTVGNSFAEPTLLNQNIGASATDVDNAPSFLGINIGVTTIPPAEMDNGKRPRIFVGTPQSPIDFELQYLDTEIGDFVTYDRIRRVDSGVGVYIDEQLDPRTLIGFKIRSDPRSDRFGVTLGFGTPLSNRTVRPDSGPGEAVDGKYIGLLSDNLATSLTHYPDPDGQVRPADGAYVNGSGSSGYPLATGNMASRPVVLNRAFRSVGEMGYASRGAPWKHLDFFSKKSGDAALLDLFCVNEPALAQGDETAVEAGYFNLNTKQVPVLNALFQGALKAEDDAGSFLTQTDAQTFSASLTSLTQGVKGPLLNKAELVTRWMDTLPATSDDSIIKRRKESVIRALSDTGTTRTWNLLIDIVAQSGRYATGAQNINQFTVEGERRLWLHVVIDRYSGKVVARQLETVHE